MRSLRFLARTTGSSVARTATFLYVALSFSLSLSAAMSETLRGEVNDNGETDMSKPIVPMPAPVLAPAKPLEGTIQKEDKKQLEGDAEDEDGQLTGMTPGLGKDGALKG